MKYSEDVPNLSELLHSYSLETKFSLSDKKQQEQIIKAVEQEIVWSEHDGNEAGRSRWVSIYEQAQILPKKEAYLEHCAIQIIDITRKYVLAHLPYNREISNESNITACDLLEEIHESLTSKQTLSNLRTCFEKCLVQVMNEHSCIPFTETRPIYAVVHRARELVLEIINDGLKSVDE